MPTYQVQAQLRGNSEDAIGTRVQQSQAVRNDSLEVRDMKAAFTAILKNPVFAEKWDQVTITVTVKE